jgi:hypothetical protein
MFMGFGEKFIYFIPKDFLQNLKFSKCNFNFSKMLQNVIKL